MRTFCPKIVFIGFVWMVLFAVPPVMSGAQLTSSCSDAAVPGPIRELLKSEFSQWRPKQITDMDADDQQLWLSGSNGKDCPGIAIGHFENMGSLSYAILLVPRSNPTGGYKIVVFDKKTGEDGYTWVLLDHAEEETYSGLVISRARPGKYADWEGKKSIQVKTDAVYVEWMEKGAQLYYWSAGRYHKLQVSD
jgi:hypothetical protein